MHFKFLILFFLLLSGCSLQTEQSEVKTILETHTPTATPTPTTLLLPNKEKISEYSEKHYLPIFMFHYIENIPENTSDKVRYTLSFSPERLEQFLQYFQKNNIQTLTFYDVARYIEKNEPLPKNSVILSFDDGHNDHYSDAFKLLEKYKMKGVFYIITNKPDNDSEYMSWEEIEEISKAGHEIGSHTKTHADLRNLSIPQKENEILGSQKILKDRLQKKIISFCYPAGKYNQEDINILNTSYLFARTTKNGKSLLFTNNKNYELPTVRIFPTTGVASLAYWFSAE